MRVESLKDIADLLRLQESLGHDKRYCFRGQSNAMWDLVPTVFRPLVDADPPIEDSDSEWIAKCERDIYREFQRRARAHSDIQDEWELLCVARHYGTPTRLLDWTRNLIVASYFALSNPSSHNAALWCLNLSDFPFPQSLGRQVPNGGYRLDNARHYCTDVQPSFLQKVSKPLVADTPDGAFIVFEVPPVVPRIEYQDGIFSVYLSFDDYDLVWNYSDYISQVERDSGLELLIKAVIPSPEANKVREQLEHTFRINPYRLFPDLFGLGMLLKGEHSRAFRECLEHR